MKRKQSKRSKPRREKRSTFGTMTIRGATVPASGVRVDETTALGNSAVWSGVRLISESFGSLPCSVYQRVNGISREAEEHPLYNVLHWQPNPEMSSQSFFESLENHVITYGNSFAEIERAKNGKVLNLWPMMPTTRRLRYPDGTPYYRVPVPGSEAQNIPVDDILHVPGLGFDGICGYPVVYVLNEVIGLGLATQQYAAEFFGNSGEPGGVLEHPGELSKDAGDRVRTSWEAKHTGLGNRHRVAILEEGMKYVRTASNAVESQLNDARRLNVVEICRVLRVPPHMLYELSQSTLNNIEHQSIEFVTYTLSPWVRRWELELRRKLFTPAERAAGYYVKFNVAALLRGDLKSRYEAYSLGLNNGFLNPDEVRRFEDMPPIPDGSGQKFLRPSTMQAPGGNQGNDNANAA